jgi:hypothetical protein
MALLFDAVSQRLLCDEWGKQRNTGIASFVHEYLEIMGGWVIHDEILLLLLVFL